MKIDGQELVLQINKEIEFYQEERDGAVKSGWYEKAAKCQLKIEGIKIVKQMIELGDYTIAT